MSARVHNTTPVEVPEASPDSNDQKTADNTEESKPTSRRNLWIGLGVLLVVIITMAIAVPLSLKKDDTNLKSENVVATTGSREQAGTFAESAPTGAQLCLAPMDNDTCMTEVSYQECMTLANNGCENIYATFSCPPHHRCGDEQPEKLPAEEDAVVCTIDVKECEDGSFVGRAAPNCEFEACPEEAVACTMEVKTCADGTSVGRSGPNCEFEICPEETPVMCTMELAYCPDGTPVGRTSPYCHYEACPDDACPMGTYMCDDGTELERDPTLGCEYPACPETLFACTMDVKTCGDGSSVGRSGPNCEFEPCPEEVLVGCTMELAYCPDGAPVGRSGPNCQFEACSDGACPTGTYTCEDGTELVRDLALGCEYPKCEEAAQLPAPQRLVSSGEDIPVGCTMEVKSCADGSFVGRSGPNCIFEDCPEDMACTMDVKSCANGSFVGRSDLNCEFEQCPEDRQAACTMELKTCPDGSSVGRGGPNCEFEECPENMPVGCTRDFGICPDGTSVGRTSPNCDFAPCPGGACTVDTYFCSSGNELTRDPANNCQFPGCP